METKNYLELIKEKIMDEARLKQHLKIWRMFEQEIIFTNGCFDLVHTGHLTLLSQAKDLGGKLIIGLNSDDSTKRLKGEGRPINNQDDRALLLACLQIVDAVIFFDEDTPVNLIEMINPDHLVKGGDYTIDQIAGADLVIKNGGKVEIIPMVEGLSSTNIINRIL